jgi:hypothetical protein
MQTLIIEASPSSTELSAERSIVFGPGSVRLDIANDGQLRPVTLINSLPFGQNALQVQGLAIWHADGKRVDRSFLDLLGELKPDRTIWLFSYNGKIYIDDLLYKGSKFEHRSIKKIVGKSIRVLCSGDKVGEASGDAKKPKDCAEGGQQEMVMCVANEYKAADLELNKLYK